MCGGVSAGEGDEGGGGLGVQEREGFEGVGVDGEEGSWGLKTEDEKGVAVRGWELGFGVRGLDG